MKLFALSLGLANGLLWALGGSTPVPGSETLQQKIRDLEAALPERAAVASWAARVQPLLEPASTETPVAVLARLQALGQAQNFRITETAHHGENPWRITLAGQGSYRAVATLLSELERAAACRLDRLRLETTDDGQLDTALEAVVRSGPWSGTARPGELPEPLPELAGPLALGAIDLFSLKTAPAPVPVSRPVVRFLGLYADAGTPTAILEEGGQTHLVPVGERTPAGLHVSAADAETLELTDERGSSWRTPMAKPR